MLSFEVVVPTRRLCLRPIVRSATTPAWLSCKSRIQLAMSQQGFTGSPRQELLGSRACVQAR
eukprot:13602442-Alexandrium_andersonii.AAC.1